MSRLFRRRKVLLSDSSILLHSTGNRVSGFLPTSFIQSGVRQRHTYQQRQQQHAYSGHAGSPTAYGNTQEDSEEDEEDSEEDTDSDEEDEEDDEDEEQLDPRYNPQNKRQKYTRVMASIASGPGVPIQNMSRGYDQNFEERMVSTQMPKRKLRLKPKVKMNEKFRGQQTYRKQSRPAGGLICGGCDGSIIGRIVSAMGSRWHPACFRCAVCNELLEHVSSYEHEGQPYCHLDYHEVRSSLRRGGGE